MIGLIVASVFSERGLPFDSKNALDHLETFAGEMSVTIGELKDHATAGVWSM